MSWWSLTQGQKMMEKIYAFKVRLHKMPSEEQSTVDHFSEGVCKVLTLYRTPGVGPGRHKDNLNAVLEYSGVLTHVQGLMGNALYTQCSEGRILNTHKRQSVVTCGSQDTY